ncbi:TRAP transporter large permease subunit [Bacillus sp. ISL-40]|uniref:TRAP transporter large permease subunit n=1 Tax=unclassified Bacillus (in: firmicutes) TaxID=185979 RepID=UPI001BE7B22A|nr:MULTISPECIES: TRAP transporter large permease subunit [unclassified Bacillus (in: firmicutes)]MBT2701303.1 TRAP transporter large permease subunit [Bacillus sp. ISL-40]MBT2744581.1 TRAP transporter large permease subunit [Bacillus sp. ISL-77]
MQTLCDGNWTTSDACRISRKNILIVNLAIGFITPPVGVNLFVGSGISGLTIETLAPATIPFLIAMILCLTVITVIPEVSLFLVD